MALRVEIHRDCFLRRLGRLGHRAWHVPRTIQHPFSCGYDSSAVCRISFPEPCSSRRYVVPALVRIVRFGGLFHRYGTFIVTWSLATGRDGGGAADQAADSHGHAYNHFTGTTGARAPSPPL
jgi:hypothetical protein